MSGQNIANGRGEMDYTYSPHRILY